MIYLSYTLRAISMAGRYALIEAEIPVLPMPPSDDTLSHFQEKPAATIDARIPLVLLTRDAFIFGTAQAFAIDLTNVRSKFYVPHVEGAPNLPRLAFEMTKWMDMEGLDKGPKVLLFVPTEEIPMPIIIQCMAALKDTGLFEKVVLGGGLI